ncbi:MAG TPA: hypothetical protein VJX93_00510 [Candidatus Methanomethylophilaceae archaeon]|nr:hypothetical protein [Candidatus Methanomethylophilaceae archaeon]
MISEKKHGLGYSMLGFFAVSFFLLMLTVGIVDYGLVLGEDPLTDLVGSDSEIFLILGGLGGILLAFSAIGKFEKDRPGRIGEGMFILLAGVFLVWGSLFEYGDTVTTWSLNLTYILILLAMISAIYDDFDKERHLLFGSVTIVFFAGFLAMRIFATPEVYQIGILVAAAFWLYTRSFRDLYV